MSLADLLRQLSILIGLPAVLLAGIGAALVVIPRDWRLVLAGYMLFSVMLSLLLSQIKGFPTEWALQQAIVASLVAVVLYLSARQLRWVPLAGQRWEARWPRMASLTTFRLLAVGLLAVAFFAVRQSIELPMLEPLFRDALLWVTLISLLGLALHEEPLHAGLSLLTFLAGTELLLFSLTKPRVLVGLMQGGQVLLGLAIAYLTLARGLPSRVAQDLPGDSSGGEA